MTWLQLFLTAVAGFALWRLWRASGRAGRAISLIVGGGFVVRALVGQALFWISWMGWPIGRSLQLGQGLWFFGLDAVTYLTPIPAFLAHGLITIIYIDARWASHFYQQILTLAMAAFGMSPAVGLLVNLLAYLGTCAVVLRVGPDPGTPTWPRLAALAAIAFSPSGILWSLQPLKDTVFLFFVAAFVAAMSAWERGWTQAGRRTALAAVTLVICIYAISGIRWYFGAILCLSTTVFFGVLVLQKRPGWRSFAAPILTLLLLVVSFRLGGDGDIPRSIRNLTDPALVWAGASPLGRVLDYVVLRRRGYQTTAGATTIVVAPTTPAPTSASRPAPAPAPTPSADAEAGQGDGLIWPRLVALVLPKSVAASVGVEMGGGRGLWAFADLDTLVFDLVVGGALLVSVWRLVSERRAPPPLLVALAVVLVTSAVLMLYIVNNFGTLFRLRAMLYLIALLMPLAFVGRVMPEWKRSA